jgi:hypothetical protein
MDYWFTLYSIEGLQSLPARRIKRGMEGAETVYAIEAAYSPEINFIITGIK